MKRNYAADDMSDKEKLILASSYLTANGGFTYGNSSDPLVLLTKGFGTCVGGAKVKKWSASEESVATADSKGKVTAKKAGKTLIRAKLDNGEVLTCHVIVKANKYSVRRIVPGDVPDGQWGIAAYAASFDAKEDKTS